MATVGFISKGVSRTVDRLPRWAKRTLATLAVIGGIYGSIYCIAREGFWLFLIKVIFSPDL